jgi:hypothetical protein
MVHRAEKIFGKKTGKCLLCERWWKGKIRAALPPKRSKAAYRLALDSTDRRFAFARLLARTVGGRLIAPFVATFRQLAFLIVAVYRRVRMSRVVRFFVGLLRGVGHGFSPGLNV